MSKFLRSNARTWFFFVGCLSFASLSWLLTFQMLKPAARQ